MKLVLICSSVFFIPFMLSAQLTDVSEAKDVLKLSDGNADSSNLSLHMYTDCWPEETSWILADFQGETLYEGGPYYNQSLTEITEEFWLETGVYTFTFYDAAGDGLYATQWGGLCDENGSFELVDAGGNVLLQDNGTSNFDSLSVTFDFNAAVSVSENPIVQSIRTYPNPFSDHLWLDLQLRQSERITIEVFSLDGRLQHRLDAIQLPSGNSNLQLGLDQLEAGPYLLRISSGSQSETRRVVKLK